MRYFLITFTPTDKFGIGNILCESKDYPSKVSILNKIREYDSGKNNVNDIAIIYIHEFNNQVDYNNYRNEE